MCGRTFISETKELAKQAGLSVTEPDRAADSNRPPGSEMPVILDARPGELHYILWGLIPNGAVDRPAYNTFYAKKETMATLPTYAGLVGRRHCVFVMKGFYEWCSKNADRQPFYFERRDGGVIYCAGLWDTWRDVKNNITIPSCTMIMQPANSMMAEVHNRMPCILDDKEVATWLDRELPPAERLLVLHEVPNELLVAWPVDKRVNNSNNKDADLNKPYEGKLSLFD